MAPNQLGYFQACHSRRQRIERKAQAEQQIFQLLGHMWRGIFFAASCGFRELAGGRGRVEGCAFDMSRGDSVRERRQVACAHARRRLESRSYLNQFRLAERRSKKTNAERRAKHDTGRH